MSVIKSIHLINFQSHTDSKLEFHDGVNVITGPSDQGKSSIIRALRWVLYNQPKGGDIIHHGQNKCSVSVKLDNGTEVTRVRQNNSNKYIIITDGNKAEYSGVSNEVLRIVQAVLHISPVFLDKDQKPEINIAKQLDPPFLLSGSGSVRAKAIGTIVGVHFIDAASRNVSSNIKEINSKLNYKAEELQSIDEQLDKYSNLERQKIQIDKANKTYEEVENKIKRLKALNLLKKRLSSHNKAIDELDVTLAKTKQVSSALTLIQQAENYGHRLSSLNSISTKLYACNQGIKRSLTFLEKASFVDKGFKKTKMAQNTLEDLNSTIKAKSKLDAVNKEMLASQKIIEKTNELPTNLEKLQQVIFLNDKLATFKQLYSKLSAYNRELKSIEQKLFDKGVEKEITRKINSIELKVEENKKVKEVYAEIRTIESRRNKGAKYLLNLSHKHKLLVNDLNRLLNSINHCPLCEQDIPDSQKNKILSKWKEV
ncbi:AAA family ATPase [Proteinivorax hydrogeniformans]|uniref:Nuclease SbcCD subunit C n=1 Tax=Proteinivorax hydrogeniformans TaxID=1826727 RepID=A0AAU8HNY9_9FIRM